jgi:hypothetical protein
MKKETKNEIKEQGHGPLWGVLQAPGACCKNKLKYHKIK